MKGAKLEPGAARMTFLAVLAIVWSGCGALGQTESPGRETYAEEAARLAPLVESGDAAADIVEDLYFAWIRSGQYALARSRFEELAAEHPNSGAIGLAAARAIRGVGDYERALLGLEPIISYADVGVAALHEKAAVLRDVGRREESDEIYSDLLNRFLDGFIRGGPDLLYVVRAMWALDQFHDANDLFRVIAQGDPNNAEVFLAWGDLLAEKYNDEEAVASYQDALALDPNMPEAHLGIARLLAATNPEQSKAALETALAVNPNFIEAHLFRAERRIGTEEYDVADGIIESVLAVNPRSAHALALLATTHYLRDDESEFERYVAEVLGTNPSYSEMYFILAERCVNVRQYAKAVEFAREAILLDPRHWKAYNLLGINLLRIGEEEEGLASLETSYDNDPFNIWTVNTLTLIDSLEDFDRIETEHFRIKLHKEEREALEPYVTDLLEEVYDTLTTKYEFIPDGPITFEMYPDHEDFAVRTLGLPGLGGLGVSFGKVIVMDSPSARPPESFNWGSTLWHEFAHVITLQITDHRIPRWFSEGISVYEERRARPGWGDDLGMDFLLAIQADQFLPIAELNNGFVRPDNPGQISLSYYQASLVCEYIDEQHGFDAIRQMLALFKDGRNTEQALREVLRLGFAEFDDAFSGWVESRTGGIDVEAFRTLLQDGHQAFGDGDLDRTVELLTEAVEAYPEYTSEFNPYETLADVYVQQGDTSSAIAVLDEFISYSEYAYGTYLQLAGLLVEAGELGGAIDVLNLALYVHPLDLDGHRELGSALLTEERYEAAVREYQTLIALKTPDLADTYFKLATAQFSTGDRTGARRSILRSLEIAPSFEAAQELLLRIAGRGNL